MDSDWIRLLSNIDKFIFWTVNVHFKNWPMHYYENKNIKI